MKFCKLEQSITMVDVMILLNVHVNSFLCLGRDVFVNDSNVIIVGSTA